MPITTDEFEGMSLETSTTERVQLYSREDVIAAFKALAKHAPPPMPTRIVPIVSPQIYEKYRRGELSDIELMTFAAGFVEAAETEFDE